MWLLLFLPRMIDKKDSEVDSVMIDINYKQDKNGSEIVSILDKLYLCASVEFLLTVADFFVKSVPAPSTETTAQFQLKQATHGKPKSEKGESSNNFLGLTVVKPSSMKNALNVTLLQMDPESLTCQ